MSASSSSSSCNRHMRSNSNLSLELVGRNSDSSSRHGRAGGLAPKSAPHAAAAGSAAALRQAQHQSYGLHCEVGALSAAPHL